MDNKEYGENKPEHRSAERRAYNLGILFLGFVLVFFGLMFLLDTFDAVSLRLNINFIWPLIVLWAGFSFIRTKSGAVFVAYIIIFAVIFGLLGFILTSERIPAEGVESEIAVAIEEGTEEANIIFRMGAVKLVVSSPSDELISGTFTSDAYGINTTSQREGNTQTVNITGGPEAGAFFGGKDSHMDLLLASGVPFNITFEGGASDIDMDLQNVIVRSVTINVGASDISLALGGGVEDNANIKIGAGASSIDITVPSDVGVRVETRSGLTSQSFEDFITSSEGVFISENYDSSEKNIFIDLDLGVSDVNVRQR